MSNVQNTVKQIFRKYIKDTFKQDVVVLCQDLAQNKMRSSAS